MAGGIECRVKKRLTTAYVERRSDRATARGSIHSVRPDHTGVVIDVHKLLLRRARLRRVVTIISICRRPTEREAWRGLLAHRDQSLLRY